MTDAELIAEYRRTGEPAALDALVRRHIGRVRAVVYPMVLDEPTADDLTQESILRAVRALPSFRGDSEFSTWLCSIAMNCVRNHLERRPPQSAPLDWDIDAQTADSPEQAAMGRELDEAIRGALEKLSPTLRAAVVLIAINGRDASEAAAIAGCTPATMHSRLHEARRRLRELLKGRLV